MSRRFAYSCRIKQLLDEGGLPRLAAAAFRKLMSAWIESGCLKFFCTDFHADIPNYVSNLDLSIRQAGVEDLGKILEVYDLARSQDKILKRFHGGDRCFIAINDRGEAVNASWISTRFVRVPELNLKLPLAPGEIYSYDVYTRRDMRQRRIDSAVRSLTYRYLHKEGHYKLFLYVCGNNLPGLSVAQRFLNPAGTIRYFRLSHSGQILFPRNIQARSFKEFLGEIRVRREALPNEVSKVRDAPAA